MRVVMFVYNEVTFDSRVLREAASLAAAGHDVSIVGRAAGTAGAARPDGSAGSAVLPVGTAGSAVLPVGTAGSAVMEEVRDSVRIIRVASPTRWRDWWEIARVPWRPRAPLARRWSGGRLRDRVTALTMLIVAVLCVPIRVPIARDAVIRLAALSADEVRAKLDRGHLLT